MMFVGRTLVAMIYKLGSLGPSSPANEESSDPSKVQNSELLRSLAYDRLRRPWP